MKMLFYRFIAPTSDHYVSKLERSDNVQIVHWKPSLICPYPRGLRQPFLEMSSTYGVIPLYLWWAKACVCRKSDYSVILIIKDFNIIHFTVALPSGRRFPFMGSSDIQFGPSWTHIDHRKKGLLRLAVGQLLLNYYQPLRVFWWLCEDDNIPSRSAIEKVGFSLYGEGARMKRYGIRALGRFELTQILDGELSE